MRIAEKLKKENIIIASPCESCCFLNERKCSLNKFSIDNGKTIFAPGFCRLFRSKEWGRQNADLDLIKLERKARSESAFKYDLIILFDNIKNTIDELKLSLYVNHLECKQIIIADITKQKNDKRDIIDIFKNKKDYTIIPLKLDILLDKNESIDQSIRRISKLCNEKYFVIIPCGKQVLSHENYNMCMEINEKDTRFIHWKFKNNTNILYGIYIKSSYDKLMSLYNESFENILIREEEQTNLLLSDCCCNV